MILSLAVVHEDRTDLGLALSGDIDGSWTEWLESSLACLLFRRFDRVTLDLGGVGFCDLDGARVLLRFKALVELDGATLRMTGGGPAVRLLGLLSGAPAVAETRPVTGGVNTPEPAVRHLPLVRGARPGAESRPRRPFDVSGPAADPADPAVHPALRRAAELRAIMRDGVRTMRERAAANCADLADLHDRLARMHEFAGHALDCDSHQRKAAEYRARSNRHAVA
ncbi:STAS domain-containing protein [Herbidospora cretacea]|uniref:STAS domain-containing protein n=1 Tax=Herbidospora cretacea TaxID=28444 RepID=UPI0004C2F2C9|nr:STAS domain-containing protein [Herbidospora cretacea]